MLKTAMRTYAIIFAGLLIAVISGGAIMWINRYEIAQPFSPMLFQRYDRWTGRVEVCSSMYDEKTYCGADLRRRSEEAVKAQHAGANLRFRSFGYSQEQIDRWPKNVLERARNLAGNGGSDAELAKFLEGEHVSSTKPENKPTAEEIFGPAPAK